MLSSRFFVLSFLALACLAAGCQKPAAQTYYAPVDRTFEVQPSPDRLMGAFVPRGQYLWTFKAVGPADQIAKSEASFLAFLKTLKFEKDDHLPTWELPSGWEVQQEDPVKRMGRYITIKLPDAKDVDFAVSRAESDDEITKTFLASNLARWRGQLGNREEFRPSEYDEFVGHVDASGVDVHTISVYGEFSGGPMAPRQTPEAQPKQPSAKTSLKHEVPEGWKAMPAGGFSVMAFEIAGDDNTKADLTVSPLGPFTPPAHTLLENINRWRVQAKLEPLDEAAVAALPKIKVGNDEAVLVEAISDVEGATSVVGAICDKGSRVWFLKLSGPAALVSREKENFLKFASSLELP